MSLILNQSDLAKFVQSDCWYGGRNQRKEFIKTVSIKTILDRYLDRL